METYYKEIKRIFCGNLSELQKEQLITNILIDIKSDGIRHGQARTIDAVVDSTERLRLAVFTQLGH